MSSLQGSLLAVTAVAEAVVVVQVVVTIVAIAVVVAVTVVVVVIGWYCFTSQFFESLLPSSVSSLTNFSWFLNGFTLALPDAAPLATVGEWCVAGWRVVDDDQ